MNEKKILAWHFLPYDRRMRYHDSMLVEPGYIYTAHGPLKMCRWGMHASVRAIDALGYAPGSIVCRVRVWGDIERCKDKLVARHREVLWMADAKRALWLFACDVAVRACANADVTDPDILAAPATRRRWLDGEATGDEMSAAWSAARSAAWSAE